MSTIPLSQETRGHLLQMPDAPEDIRGPVKAWSQSVSILTYSPHPPDLNPMFLEKRVYQGSSGRVYPLPFYDRIATEPEDRLWEAIHIENEYLRVMILPEIGGRIHVGYDKTTGYDFFYRQNVIKPALVGLAGPWISGGVEFNWPQHHRPATFMPVNTEIESSDDGSITVWCSDHDPMLRMKGMHGVCLHPGKAILELKARLYNRTQFTQTFLWWANVAARVHEKYQSFFPTDVRFVADHAKRAVTSFPFSDRPYYGIDYAERAHSGVPTSEMPRQFVPDGSYAANDLSWYANIPVPTSYMVTGTAQDFFGGYDHARKAGVVHVANHHIAPGKKQWTWGNHEFGYAWDRNLTDHDGPYIELMAGVYTDNQPDFSYLAPWETKTFTQSWFPIHAIGVPHAANIDAALHLKIVGLVAHLGLQVTRDHDEITLKLESGNREIFSLVQSVTVAEPLILVIDLPEETDESKLAVTVSSKSKFLIDHNPPKLTPAKPPIVAEEPGAPADIATVEELNLIGLHLNQYHHATRQPEIYWREALIRDPENSQAHNAMGLWHLRRGELDLASQHLTRAIARLTKLNPNPYDCEPYYNLGIVERFMGNTQRAYDALYKATWSAAWRGPAYFALAEIDVSRHDWQTALDHLRRSLRSEADSLNARNLLVVVLQALGHDEEADAEHLAIREIDPLDSISRWKDNIEPSSGQERLDLAFDLLRSGQRDECVRVLGSVPQGQDGAGPIALFALAQIQAEIGEASALVYFQAAEDAKLDYCFPSRIEEMLLLQAIVAAHPDSATAHYLLGNCYYDRRRHEDAIQCWEIAGRLNPKFATTWRNLGIALFNERRDAVGAKSAFDLALAAGPDDGRVLYERDQLWKRIGERPDQRLSQLLLHPALIQQRDDLSVELVTLLNQVGRSEEALELLLNRHFQPWEGGEGLVLGQYVRSRLLLGQTALISGQPQLAEKHFRGAKEIPSNLSEAKHLLANQSDVDYWLGVAYEAMGDMDRARTAWESAARQRGDFQRMAVLAISDMTYWTAMAQLRLGEREEANETFRSIYNYSIELEQTQPTIDYFATSLPTMLLFEEDLVRRNRIEALVLRGQALLGLEKTQEAIAILHEVLGLDSNHTAASDLLQQNQTHRVGSR